MLAVVPTTQFVKDVKKARKRGKDIKKLEAVVSDLAAGKPLSPRLRDQA